MSIIKKFSSINGNYFDFQAKADDEEIHVLQTGYIVSKTGEIVAINNSDSHSDIISNFLFRYLESNDFVNYEIIEGAKKLTDLNFVVYLGTKLKDAYGGLNQDALSILLVPDLKDISTEQKDFINDLINSNKPRFSFKKNSELILMTIANISQNNREYTKDEFLEKISISEHTK